MTQQALEKLHGAIRLDIVPTQAEVDDRLVVCLQSPGQLLEPNAGETILAQIKLSKFGVVLDNLTNDA